MFDLSLIQNDLNDTTYVHILVTNKYSMSLPSGTMYIHYRKREICLVQNDLPGAFYRTPGK